MKKELILGTFVTERPPFWRAPPDAPSVAVASAVAVREMMRFVVAACLFNGAVSISCTTTNAAGQCYELQPGPSTNPYGWSSQNATASCPTLLAIGVACHRTCVTPGFCPMSETVILGVPFCEEIAYLDTTAQATTVTPESNKGLIGCQVDSDGSYRNNRGGTTSSAWTGLATRRMFCVSPNARFGNAQQDSNYNDTTYLGQLMKHSTAPCTPFAPPSAPPTPPRSPP